MTGSLITKNNGWFLYMQPNGHTLVFNGRDILKLGWAPCENPSECDGNTFHYYVTLGDGMTVSILYEQFLTLSEFTIGPLTEIPISTKVDVVRPIQGVQ